jgi:type VI secretion system protein ImpA
MKREIDIEAILAPLVGDNPAGEDTRYLPLYDEIKESRRADDVLDRGDWNRELKTAEWDKVISLSVDALTKTTKDLQIAAWLLEALIKTEGFNGVETGLDILIGLLESFWEHLYPAAEDGDLDFRCGPLEFVNDKLSMPLKEISLTDRSVTPGYSWLQWQESVKVGRETDTLNQFGDTDESKRKARDLLIEEGKLTGEQFESAVQNSSRDFYEQLMKLVQSCQDKFQRLDEVVDEKFGNDAPRISDFKASIEDCVAQITKILKEKRRQEPDPGSDSQEQDAVGSDEDQGERYIDDTVISAPQQTGVVLPAAQSVGGNVNRLLGSGGLEELRWQEAQAKLKKSGIDSAVELLLGAACSAQSIREKSNYYLLIAKLCLQAKRADLARPIAEQLFAQMEELQLGRWESPIWIAEVLEILYRCLTVDGAPDDDRYRAQDILMKICTTDITKAMKLRR